VAGKSGRHGSGVAATAQKQAESFQHTLIEKREHLLRYVQAKI